MKKINDKVSRNKAKRYAKNKRRLKDKPYLSKFERRQKALREQIVGPFLRSVNPNE